jgi:hypothetical protein
VEQGVNVPGCCRGIEYGDEHRVTRRYVLSPGASLILRAGMALSGAFREGIGSRRCSILMFHLATRGQGGVTRSRLRWTSGLI